MAVLVGAQAVGSRCAVDLTHRLSLWKGEDSDPIVSWLVVDVEQVGVLEAGSPPRAETVGDGLPCRRLRERHRCAAAGEQRDGGRRRPIHAKSAE